MLLVSSALRDVFLVQFDFLFVQFVGMFAILLYETKTCIWALNV